MSQIASSYAVRTEQLTQLALPNSTSNAAAITLGQTERAPLVLANPEEALNAALALDRVNVTDEELRSYFEEFTGHEWSEAAQAMRVSLAYLRAVLSEAASRHDWCLVHVG